MTKSELEEELKKLAEANNVSIEELIDRILKEYLEWIRGLEEAYELSKAEESYERIFQY